ncbi:hypothetical protein [Sphingomonas sp.]|jgi:hypothetical protein|uniref:hypothetical protein n=1 Tax=Sphingomonas sp. TaxID=28214 RepID=UPI00260CA2DF|nr:hypothetical protein [Sphingomonas sp.]MDF2493279.1 hypothetical protein [Sphingomonas sp.]
MPAPSLHRITKHLFAKTGIEPGEFVASQTGAGPKTIGRRFAHLRLGRDLPAAAVGKSPAIARAAALKPAVSAAGLAQRAHARTKAVFASEASRGRERQAAAMIHASMSAREIVELLGTQPLDNGMSAESGADAANPMLAALLRAGGKPL